jgi:3-phosphoshikimate 1-carboxyvinyltransferase
VVSRQVLPIRSARATLGVPGDKSIAHRAAILGAIAEGVTAIEGFPPSQDCVCTLAALRSMGVSIDRDGTSVAIAGAGLHGLREPAVVVHLGNSGTAIRLLAGLAAGQPFRTVLTGDASIRRRPMDRIVKPLTQMGARIRGEENDTRAPLHIYGGNLHGIHYETPVASAQVKSAVLLAGLFAEGATSVREPHASRDHTERMLVGFGARVRREGTWVSVEPRPTLSGWSLRVPGDISSAAFFLVAGLLVSDADVRIEGVGVNPTRTGILDALREMGADISVERETMVGGEPVADIRARTSRLRAATFGGDLVVRMMDELPILALAASQAHGETLVRDAAELRVKETDRIAAIVGELGQLGIEVTPAADGFRVRGPQKVRGGSCQSRGDHRIAMTGAIAGLIAENPTVVHDVAWVDTSFPGFWELLQRL